MPTEQTLDELLRQQQNGTLQDDDDEDLSNAPRGDTVANDKSGDDKPADKSGEEEEEEEEEEEKEQEDEGQERDEKGRFAKKDDKSGEEEEEEEEEDSSKDNFPVRLNKMKDQRDRERAERERLEARVRELESGSKPEKKEPEVDPVDQIKADLVALYEQVEELRADGNTKEAAKLQLQIDEKREEIAELKAAKVAGKATAEAAENARYDALLDQIEDAVPVLNSRSDDFDQRAVDALEFHREAYEKMGKAPTVALKMAAGLLFGFGAKKAAAPTKPAEKKDEVLPPKKDLKKAIANAGKQPPDSSGHGTNRGDDTTIKASQLTEEEFDALPEKKKAQMRGDFITG